MRKRNGSRRVFASEIRRQPRIADKTSDGGALKRSFTRVDPGAQLERLAMSTSGKQTRYPSIIANTIATLTNAQVFGYMSIHAMAAKMLRRFRYSCSLVLLDLRQTRFFRSLPLQSLNVRPCIPHSRPRLHKCSVRIPLSSLGICNSLLCLHDRRV